MIATLPLLAVLINLAFPKSMAGDMAYGVAGALCGVGALYDFRLPKHALTVVVVFFLIGLLYLILMLKGASRAALTNTAAIFVCAFVFIYFAKYAPQIMRSRLFLLLCVPSPIVALFSDMPKNALNGSAAYLALLATLLVSARFRGLVAFTIIIVGLSFVLCTSLALNHRIMVGLSALGIVGFVFLHGLPSRLLRLPGFLAIAATTVGVVALYVNLLEFQQFEAFNSGLVSLTGRGMLSGREIIWPIVVENIMTAPIVGHGPGTLPRDLFNTTLSAHNLFLQIALQSGLVGLTLLSLLLWTLWSGLSHSKFAMVVFVIAVLDSSFEVFLLQNLLSAGLPAWMIFGLSVRCQSAQSSAMPIAPTLMPAPPRRLYTLGP